MNSDIRLTGDVWDETFPDRPWPGMRRALGEMGDEIKALRLLTDTIVTTALDEHSQNCTRDEHLERAEQLMKNAVAVFERAKVLYGECNSELQGVRRELRAALETKDAC